MSNLIPGNQKHLTQEDRVFIETSLDKAMPFKEIAKYLCKDPSTISKEVRKHRIKKERNDFNSPNRCIKKYTCGKTNVCNRTIACKKRCVNCAACNKRCDQFEEEICPNIIKAPYVCNSCPKKAQCRMEKFLYKAVPSHREYRSLLKESRVGINISEANLVAMDELVTPLVLKGQTPYMILEAHTELGCSAKTIYNYIEAGALSVKNIDLKRKVRYKLRKPPKGHVRDSGIYEGRTYKDFQTLLLEHPDTNVVEMDTVLGCEGSNKVFLTLYFRNSKLMLIYLLPDRKQESVKKVFDTLEKRLSTIGFNLAFPVILADRGVEFQNPDALETGIDGIIRTSIYFCDPLASWQKAGIEKNHEYIRYVLPKGSSFDRLSQWDATKLANHINSAARASLNGHHPYELALMLIGSVAIIAFNLREIPPDDINLTPALLK